MSELTQPNDQTTSAAAARAEGQATAHAVSRAFTPLPHDHPVFAVLGRITAEAAQFEHVLDLIIWDLAHGEPVALASITAQINGPGPRYNAVLSLAQIRGLPEPLLKRIEKMRGKALEGAEKRNRAIHDAWFVDMATAEPAQFMKNPRGKHRFGITDVAFTTLQEALAEVEKLKEAATKLRGDLLAAMQTS